MKRKPPGLMLVIHNPSGSGDDAALLPNRGVWIHGFADATGVASDLLEALVARLGARVWVDQPPDPARPGRIDLGAAFTERLLRRLGTEADGLRT